METFEHISLSSTNGNHERLIPVRSYLAAKLSPYDLKLIKALHDHKGSLEVTFDKIEFNHAVSYAGDIYTQHLKKILAEAWEIENEYIVEFQYD